ncbi:DNA polymerase IV, partial [bacterium]
MNTVIVHIDMDAFFCSVEQLDRPELRGKAVIVGGNPFQGRGVVSSASYEARRYGVHSAMPSKQAYRLCPNAIFLRPRFKRYEQFAERIFKLLEEYTPLVEPASIDEAYIDLSGTKSLFGDPVDTARKIKHRIKNDIGLPVSVGVAPNKLLAKIASDSGKPDGLVVVREDQISDFMEPLPIKALPGVGSKFVEKLN